MPDEHDNRPVSESAPQAMEAGAAAPKRVLRWRDPDLFAGRAAPTPPPRITAVEVENFKGIGQPVRIDLRPVTLLFGRNSAGKSTILHALAYAHEVLSNRNLDAGKTEPGGAQIDLGGFRNLVHRHDLERTVRFRFELRFENWIKGTALSKSIAVKIQEPESADPDSIYSPSIDSGWVTFTVAWNKVSERPEVASYEVGADGSLFGRLQDDGDGIVLKVNSAHPLLHAETGPPDPFARGGQPDERALRTVNCAGLTTLLPNWDEDLVLKLDSEGRDRALIANAFSQAEPEYPFDEKDFVSLVAGVLVGFGSALRDELADFRYIGPVRRLDVEPDSRTRGNWSDGSEAWNLLEHGRKDLLDEANDWLARDDRLAAGYKLRRQWTVKLSADNSLLHQIRFRKRMPTEYRNSGSWARQAREIAEDPAALEELVRAVATAPVDPTLQLLTVDSELPVRTTDVGVGISQLVPVVVAALDPDRPQLTAIEQPELHIHPCIQVELGDLFAQRIDQGGALLIETHSEHLLLRLRRRIEETHDGRLPKGKPALKPEHVSVVFVEQIEGEVRATPLRIDEDGEFIDRWPHGFFEERSEELFS